MPIAKIDDTLDMHYEMDCFAEPWREPEVIMLVHGIGGCTDEWYAWVPPLADEYAVLRVDLRGWGKSTIPPLDYQWSMDAFADDLAKLMDRLGIPKVHLVGTKLGGRIALHAAHRHGSRLHSVSLVCTPLTIQGVANDSRDRRPTIAKGAAGVEAWATSTMRERLGDVAPEMLEWWNRLYSAADPRVISEVFDLAWDTDEFDLVRDIAVPLLVLDSQAKLTDAEKRRWQEHCPAAHVVDLPVTTQGRQLTASMPLECAAIVRRFVNAAAKPALMMANHGV